MGGPPKQTIPLFWRETRQRILGPEISPYPEVVRGHEWELAGQRSWQAVNDGTRTRAVGDWTAERRDSKQSWRGTTDRGSQHRTPETVAEKRRSSHGEDRLKMSAFELLVEFSLVTHASDSLHMHVVLQYLLLLLVNPKLCSCLFVCFIFSCLPRSYSCVAVKKCALPPQPLVDHRPAVRSGMVRRLI